MTFMPETAHNIALGTMVRSISLVKMFDRDIKKET